MIRVAINGYGRIGRVAHRVILQKHASEIEVVAINAGSSTDIQGWLYLLKYDSSYGPLLNHEIRSEIPNPKSEINPNAQNPNIQNREDYIGSLVIDGKEIPVFSQKDPSLLPWKDLNVDVVIESTGHFLTKEKLQNHLTADQRLQDGGHKDYRRARAAGQNIVPTSTGATIATGEAIPELAGIFNGLAIRVPVAVGSLSDFTFLLKKSTTKEEVTEIFKKEAQNPIYNGILAVTEDPIVSSDIIGNSHSAIVDLSLTQVIGGNMVKVIAWYDNEFGYANRLVEEVIMVGSSRDKAGGDF